MWYSTLGKCFGLKMVLKHGCVMSLTFINMFIDGVLREVKAWSGTREGGDRDIIVFQE